MTILCLGLLIEAQGAKAFEDTACSRIVTTKQHGLFDLRPGEPVDMARTRAIDELDKLAVFEVVGVDVEALRADDTKLDNESNTRHANNPASSLPGETGEDRIGVARHFQDVIRSSYRGLVRIKLVNETPTGVSPHQSLDITADVTVCQPKPEAIIALDNAKAARERVPPRVVDPDKAVWFDPMSGEPQIWYWLGPNDSYTFFDKSGFDPMTGDALKLADRPFLKSWKALMDKRKKDAQDLVEAKQKQADLQKIKEDAERSQAEQRAAQEARTIQTCDDEAANPNDPRKPASAGGAKWDDLKLAAPTAVRDCETAMRLRPTELRFKYQLARAISVKDPKRALPIFRKLMEDHYPAAYDNYGWALLDPRVGRDDLTGAIRTFEAGMQAGDPSSIMSLAGLIADGRVNANSPDESLQLYRRAAHLGSADAAAAVARLEAEQVQIAADRTREAEQAREQAIQQEQTTRAMLGLVGSALGNIRRR